MFNRHQLTERTARLIARWSNRKPVRIVRRTYGRRWLLTLALASCGWFVLMSASHSEPVESGWVVGKPAAVEHSTHPTAEMRIVLDRVLQEMQVPLLKGATDPQPHAVEAAPHLADRPHDVTGWRQFGLPLSRAQNSRVNANPSQSAAASSDDQTLKASPAPQPATEQHADEQLAGSQSKPAESSGTVLQFRPPRIGHSDEAVEAEIAADAEADPEQGISDAPLDDESCGSPDMSAEIAPTDEKGETVTLDDSPAPPESSEASVTDSKADDSTENKSSDEGDDASGASAPAQQKATSSENDGSGSTAKPAPAAAKVVTPPPPLTKQLVNLRSRVRSVLKGYYRKSLNSKENDPWEVMHGMLAYGVHSRIHQGGPKGELITSVGWLCYNKPCKNLTLMYVTPEGELRAKWGVGLQGHMGQLLAMLAQCHVSADYPIHVGAKKFTIRDLVEAEKKTCYEKSELTFKLIALQYYLDLNDKWVNDQGLAWDIPKLVNEELAQPIRGAACGGTHRLSSLSLAVKTRVRRGEPLDGEYARADEFVKKYQSYAFRLQNRDGSLSTSWFNGKGDEDDDDRRIKTTGHILEWLVYSLSDEELRDPRTIRAVTYLANLMYSNYDHEWEVGPVSHATHALALYDERVFQPFDSAPDVAGSKKTKPTAKRTTKQSGRR